MFGSRKVWSALAIACALSHPLLAQEDDEENMPPEVAELQAAVQKASAEYEAKDYESSIKSWGAVLKLLGDGTKISEPLRGNMTSNAYYNSACCYALAGKKEPAIEHFAKSVAAGFTDLDHIQKDTDLDSIRNEEGYKKVIAGLQSKADEQSSKKLDGAMVEAKKELSTKAMFPFAFKLSSIDGSKELSDEALKGKVAIVDIWGTWCGPCRAEVPHFIALQKKYGEKGLTIVGLNKENGSPAEASAAVRAFIKEKGINYDCALITEEVRKQVPNFEGYPTTLLLDRKGRVRRVLVGYHEMEVLEAHVRVLLAEPVDEKANEPKGEDKKDDAAKEPKKVFEVGPF